MSSRTGRHPIALKPVVYRLEGMESARVRRNVAYGPADARPLELDIYQPAALSPNAYTPVVLLVTGYPDVGVPRPLGCAFKDMEMFISLAQLVAASGVSAVAYTTRTPASDIHLVLDHLATNAAGLRIDTTRVGLWAVSGHVPVALATLIDDQQKRIKAAILSNGFTFDTDDAAVELAARTYGFVNASAGRSANDLPADVPLFIARAGGDENPGLNPALDRFIANALARNLPVTVVNHAAAAHAFEVNDDSVVSSQIISQMLAFMRFWLTPNRD
jgi:hypothetical protein